MSRTKAISRPLLLAVLLWLAAALTANAQVPEVEIVDWGLLSARVVGRQPAPGTSAGYSLHIDTGANPTLDRSDTIDACPGTQFGIKYRLKSAGAELVELEIEWTHPPFHTPDGRTTTTDRFPAFATRDANVNGWFFEDAYELVPGEWTVSVQHEGQTLASHRFMVRVVRDCSRQVS